MLKLLNTLSGQLEEFQPISPGVVRLYVCGPTVYDHSHIGHGRAYVVYDTIVRYLRYKGFAVTYVRNITDIEDKIIRRANDEKVDYTVIAERYSDSFNADLKDLGLLPADYAPRASETVPEIISHIDGLIKMGKAYASKGDVYFSIKSWPPYGKLSGRNLDDMKAGARVEPGEQKKEPLDFALWKGAKPGEPSWDSPWGPGRPGWHIECSAMVRKLLGDSIDIHAGGRDLIFPHHENEIAQSEGFTGKPFAKYWIHNGFVNINQEKMSKSLGNIVTLRSLLEQFHPEALKLYLLSHHYRAPVDFTDVGVQESARALDRVYRALLAIPDRPTEPVGAILTKFNEAMDDDFNSAKAIALIFDAIKDANRLQQKEATLDQAVALRKTIVRMGNVLGFLQDEPSQYFKRLPGKTTVDVVEVERLIAARADARRTKNFTVADQVRNELSLKHSVVVEDSSEGTTWRIES